MHPRRKWKSRSVYRRCPLKIRQATAQWWLVLEWRAPAQIQLLAQRLLSLSCCKISTIRFRVLLTNRGWLSSSNAKYRMLRPGPARVLWCWWMQKERCLIVIKWSLYWTKTAIKHPLMIKSKILRENNRTSSYLHLKSTIGIFHRVCRQNIWNRLHLWLSKLPFRKSLIVWKTVGHVVRKILDFSLILTLDIQLRHLDLIWMSQCSTERFLKSPWHLS